MSVLDSIGVTVETAAIPADWGNALPVLHEIRNALIKLQQAGESTVIDLSAIPFGPGDRERLLETLGTGEVSARVDALGATHIHETTLPGVWRVHYHSPDDRELALHIEITRLPSLLGTPAEEIPLAIERLSQRLDSSPSAIGGTEE